MRGELVQLQLDNVVEYANRWSEAVPSDSRPYIYQARVFQTQYQLRESRDALLQAVDRRPDSGWAWVQLSFAQVIMREFEDALVAARKAIDLLEVNGQAHVAAAIALRELGRDDEARTHLEQALAIPDDALRRYYILVGERPEDVDVSAYAQLGELEMDSDRPSEALAAFEEVLKRQPLNKSALNGKSQALRQLGRRDEARELAQQVADITVASSRVESLGNQIAATPDDVETQRQLAVEMLRFFDNQTGLYWADQALEANPSDRLVLTALVDFYRDRSDAPDAAAQAARYEKRLEAAGGRLEPGDETQ